MCPYRLGDNPNTPAIPKDPSARKGLIEASSPTPSKDERRPRIGMRGSHSAASLRIRRKYRKVEANGPWLGGVGRLNEGAAEAGGGWPCEDACGVGVASF
jgi:hypothetical protein